MHEYDPEIILLVTGIIVKPSLPEKYVNHSKENIHDQTGNLYKTIFYVKVQRLPPCLRALAIIPISPHRKVVMIEAQAIKSLVSKKNFHQIKMAAMT